MYDKQQKELETFPGAFPITVAAFQKRGMQLLTIKDIARESGYAVSTVSRALNDHPDVSREAKEKIKAIVAAHKFVPNSNARQLKVQQNRSIIIVVKGAFNMFFAAILERMQSLISCSGYSAEVHYLDEDADEVLVGEQLQRERIFSDRG